MHQHANTCIIAFRESLAPVVVVALFCVALYVMLEPVMVKGQTAQETFTISTTVTDEISFVAGPNNVALGALSGITGGTGTGQTTVRVRTNNVDGFHMTLQASSSAGMLGDTTVGVIPAYVPAIALTPDYTFTTPANSARFGYTIQASSTADMVQLFLDNGTNACNQAAGQNNSGTCWLNASTSPVTILNTGSASPASGATSTIQFRVTINANPSPAIPNDTYTATTTLTVTEN